MEYQDVFQDAMRNVLLRKLDEPDERGYEKNSVFSVFINLALAAKHKNASSLDVYRNLLNTVISMKVDDRTRRYMNVNVTYLKMAIEVLFNADSRGILVGFKGYGYDDLLQYLEICKRVYQVDQADKTFLDNIRAKRLEQQRKEELRKKQEEQERKERWNRLTPAQQVVCKIKCAATEDQVMCIYTNEPPQSFGEEARIVAEAFRARWMLDGKWYGKLSRKQRIKVDDVNKILNNNNCKG
jgi:hypothetical protein